MQYRFQSPYLQLSCKRHFFKTQKYIKMKLFNKSLFVAALLSAVLFTSCDDDDPEIAHEHELITDVILHLEDTAGNEIEFHYNVEDGSESDTLAANMTYTGMVEVLNLSEEDHDEEEGDHEGHDHARTVEEEHGHEHGEDVTEEIKEEGDLHQMFYILDPAALATITTTDVDENGNPLGLEFTVVTGDAGTGDLRVVLLHEPTKPNEGLEDAGGSTDFDITFDFVVE